MKTTLPVDWRVSEREGGLSFRWGTCGEELVAEWGGVLTLHATAAGQLKSWEGVAGASEDLVEKTRRGVATAFLRALRQQHSLHASSVAWDGVALVCVGDSGAGKSTVAERLCRREGVELLADDTAAIDLPADGGALHVVPTESTLWLASDASEGKTADRSRHAARGPVALRWVAALAFNDSHMLEVRELRGADAVAALLPSLLRFQRTEGQWERELDFVSRLVAQCRVLRATRSRDVTAEAVADALQQLAERETG